MSNELIYSGNTTLEASLTVKAKLYKDGVFIQDVNCTETPVTSAVYYGDMPSITAGKYIVVFMSDTNSYLGSGIINWDGFIELTPANLPEIESLDVDGVTMQDTLKYLLATITGKTLGSGTAVNKFYDPTGSTVRVNTEFDIVGDRHTVTLNPN
jgi:hypothetical protein